MARLHTFHRKKIVLVFAAVGTAFLLLIGRLGVLMLHDSGYYSEKAQELHERERDIKAARGRILDAGGVVLADNNAVCTISVIHNHIEDPDSVIEILA